MSGGSLGCGVHHAPDHGSGQDRFLLGRPLPAHGAVGARAHLPRHDVVLRRLGGTPRAARRSPAGGTKMTHIPRLLALSTLLVCACAHVVVKYESATTPRAASGQAADVDRKLAAIADFSAQIRDREIVRGSDLIDAVGAVEAVLAVRARVLDEFRDPRFVVVHETLDDAFKRTNVESRLEHINSFGGGRVTSASFQKALKEIADLARDVTNRADVRTTFLVHTEPAGATFDICPQYLTTGCIHVTTDATIADIFRGLYTYRVLLDGYRTVAYPLDLVHFRQTRLDCRLQAKRASPCTPR